MLQYSYNDQDYLLNNLKNTIDYFAAFDENRKSINKYFLKCLKELPSQQAT